MKILLLIENNDFRVNLLVKVFEHIKEQIGFLNTVDFAAINEFSPDIIIHNTNKILPACPKVKIDQDSLKPFVDPFLFTELKYDKKYDSDVVYIGDPYDFGDNLKEILSLDCKTRLHCSNNRITGFYSGIITDKECITSYHSSKCSIIPPDDLGFRELDIIMSEGNPVKDDYSTNIKKAIDGHKFSGSMSKDEIQNKYTNFDIMSSILKANSLKGLSNMILRAKP